MAEPAPIPVVRLGEALHDGSPHAREVAHDLGHAIETCGAVYVRDHGVDEALITAQFTAAQALFALPAEERAALVRRIDAPAHDMPRERFDLFSGKALVTGAAPARLLVHGQTPPWLRDPLQRYVDAMARLSRRLLRLLALSLDRAPDAFAAEGGTAMGAFRLLNYPPATPEGAAGAQAHTDRGALTVLAQDFNAGFEIELPEGRWAPVQPCPGALLVHPGDRLSARSGSRLRSPRHRVRREGQPEHRLSVPFFFTPLEEARVA